ncbi:MAG: DUF4136 domain-containing protein [Planctomycetota bacterium]|jgi:hypothetical protein
MKPWFVLLLSLVVAACSTVRVEGDPDFTLDEGGRYTWVASALEETDVDAPISDYLHAVNAELEQRGLVRATTASSDYQIDVSVVIEREVRDQDPVFSLFVALEYEVAVLRVRIKETEGERRRWSGECRHDLRMVRRSFGGLPPMWEDLDRRREWLPEEQVDRIFARLAR